MGEDISNHKKNYELTGQLDWKTECELSIFFLFKALAFYPSCRQLDIFVLDRFFWEGHCGLKTSYYIFHFWVTCNPSPSLWGNFAFH